MADLSENLAFAALIDSLGRSRDSMRAIGLLRSDERWIHSARLLDQIQDKATQMFRMRMNGH